MNPTLGLKGQEMLADILMNNVSNNGGPDSFNYMVDQWADS